MRNKLVVEIKIVENGGVLRKERLQCLIDKVKEVSRDYQIVIISGRLPVWAFSSLSIVLAKTGKSVATFDPRLGSGICVSPVVAGTEVNVYDADKIEVILTENSGGDGDGDKGNKEGKENKGKKEVLILSGLPKSGKSITKYSLCKALKSLGISYLSESLHPDAEGSWTFESNRGQEISRELKNLLKENGQFWSIEFIREKLEVIKNISNAEVDKIIFDLGGIPSAENKLLLSAIKGWFRDADIKVVLLAEKGTIVEEVEKWGELLDLVGLEWELRITDLEGVSCKEDALERGGRIAGEILNGIKEVR